MKQILSALFLSVLIISCKKTEDDSYTITGLVLDLDARTPIAGAKVYVRKIQGFSYTLIDSSISDANGKVFFTYPNGEEDKSLFATKAGYLPPMSFAPGMPPRSVSRTQEMHLARPSNLIINLHRVNSYSPNDSFHLQVEQYYILGNGVNLSRLANSADTVITIPFVYHSFATKAYMNWRIGRNGTTISSSIDSTAFIQFGTKNYTLNY